MQKPLRFALLLIALLLAIPITRAVAIKYTHVLFLPSVSENVIPPTYDYKEVSGLTIRADCEFRSPTLYVLNNTNDTIRFTDDRSTYVYVAKPGASWMETSPFPEEPFTIKISVIGGDSASLYVWCLRPTPQPTFTPDPNFTPAPEPTIALGDPPTPTITPLPSVSPSPPKIEPTTAPSP